MKENSIFFPVIVVIFLAVLIAYGVSWYAKQSNDLSSQISKDRLSSFTNENIDYVELPPVGAEQTFVSPVETRQKQAARYDDIGQAIKSLNIGNIAYATADDLRLIGATNWSLTNTVASNLNYPQVLEVVFNNKDVLTGFFGRKDVLDLLNNYLTLTDLIENNSQEVTDLVNSPAVKGVLQDKELLTELFNSALVQEILLSRTANYFLMNPKKSKELMTANETLAPLLQNENLKEVLSSNQKTNRFASVLFN